MEKFNILVCKETRAGERRVALVPDDVAALIKAGHSIFVESQAGMQAGFSDADYEKAGAKIRTLDSYDALFQNINLVVRAKRPDREREILENQAIPEGITLVGALDPFEKNSNHMTEYQAKKLEIHSIDQLKLEPEHPMNLLAVMSKIAGKLALQDALQHFKGRAKRAAIIGFGIIGHAALEEACAQGLQSYVFITKPTQIAELEVLGATAILLDKNASLEAQQEQIQSILTQVDVVITSARAANQLAPILIPMKTLNHMQAGSVVVDMALSEGGNVEGSHHDETVILGNEVIVTNVSGYPKQVPHEASVLWSRATKLFIEDLATKS